MSKKKPQEETKEQRKKRSDETFQRARKIAREYFDRLSFEQKQDYKVSNRE
jgi:hypothetical protein